MFRHFPNIAKHELNAHCSTRGLHDGSERGGEGRLRVFVVLLVRLPNGRKACLLVGGAYIGKAAGEGESLIDEIRRRYMVGRVPMNLCAQCEAFRGKLAGEKQKEEPGPEGHRNPKGGTKANRNTRFFFPVLRGSLALSQNQPFGGATQSSLQVGHCIFAAFPHAEQVLALTEGAAAPPPPPAAAAAARGDADGAGVESEEEDILKLKVF